MPNHIVLPSKGRYMSFKIIIPARFGSTRLAGKPLLLIDDKPMIWHVYQRALETGIGASNIVIATDNTDILTVCEKFGARAMLTSIHHESGTDRLAEVVTTLNWTDNDIVVNLQGDEPLLDPEHIAQVAKLLSTDKIAGMGTLGCPITSLVDVQNPNVVKIVCDSNMFALYFSRASIPFDREKTLKLDDMKNANPPFSSPYIRHIGMYAYRVHTLKKLASLPMAPIEQIEKLEQLRALYNGINIKVGVVNNPPVHGVDTQEDLERVRLTLKSAQQ